MLTTGGPAANPSWTNPAGGGTVTQVTSGTGITVTGSPCTTICVINLATIADHTVLANISGGALAPSSTTVTALLDNALGSTQGNILYRNATVWTVLAPGTNGQVLTQGASTPSWSNAGTVSNVATGAGLSGGPITTTGTLLVDPTYFQNYISGLVLSNDSGSPNTVLDIAAGSATDSTNATLFKIGAFTKSTAGAWAVGSGSNGMGNGLTITNSTWYHVCFVPNGGTSDVYFDTSVTCANKPAGVSGSTYRRIGSFKTDGSAHILAFYMEAGSGWVYWSAPPLDQPGVNVTSSAGNWTISIPPGVRSQARMIVGNATAGNARTMVYSPDVPDLAAGFTYGNVPFNAGTAFPQQIDVWSNASAQVRVVAESGTQVLSERTLAYQDLRGQ